MRVLKLPTLNIAKLDTGWGQNLKWAGWAVLLGSVGGLAAVTLPNPLVGFGLVGGLLVGFFMLGRPLFTLMLAVTIACVLPFGVIPVKVGLTFTLLEATLLVLFVVWLLRMAARSDENRFISSQFDWAVLLFIGICIFAFILGFSGVNSTDIIHNFFKLMLSILSFFAIINIVRTQLELDKLLKLLILATSLSGWIGVGLYVLPKGFQERLLVGLGTFGYPTSGRILRFVEDDESKPQRATGTLVDPNSYGGLMVLAIAIIFVQLLSPKPLLKRWQLAGLLLGPVLALYLTYGRGAQLAAIVIIAFIATVKYRKIWLYALPFIGLGALILPNTFLWDRLLQGFRLEDQATLMRLNEYANALAVLERYPWFGVGFGDAPNIDLVAAPPSMIYLTLTTKMGLVGLGAFLLVMTTFFIFVFQHLGKLTNKSQQANLLGFAGGIIGVLVIGIFDHYFFNIEYSHLTALMWLYIALAVVQVKLGTPLKQNMSEQS